MKKNFDDIIDLPHHVSSSRPHMSLHDRAAQFSPFAALTGYESALKETSRLTTGKMELSEEELELLNYKIKKLQKCISTHPSVDITYFIPDERKEGGSYTSSIKNIKRIDDCLRILHFTDGTSIAIDDILSLEDAT